MAVIVYCDNNSAMAAIAFSDNSATVATIVYFDNNTDNFCNCLLGLKNTMAVIVITKVP